MRSGHARWTPLPCGGWPPPESPGSLPRPQPAAAARPCRRQSHRGRCPGHNLPPPPGRAAGSEVPLPSGPSPSCRSVRHEDVRRAGGLDSRGWPDGRWHWSLARPCARARNRDPEVPRGSRAEAAASRPSDIRFLASGNCRNVPAARPGADAAGEPQLALVGCSERGRAACGAGGAGAGRYSAGTPGPQSSGITRPRLTTPRTRPAPSQ
jgi:hypothetical protein